MEQPTPGRIVLYRTDGRNGLVYDLPAIVTVTPQSHPGDYPDGSANPLPVPDEGCVHLTVFTPGGFGTEPLVEINGGEFVPVSEVYRMDELTDEQKAALYKNAVGLSPGSGTYVEWNVPEADDRVGDYVTPRSWRWPR